jgi:hypothetical protein
MSQIGAKEAESAGGRLLAWWRGLDRGWKATVWGLVVVGATLV